MGVEGTGRGRGHRLHRGRVAARRALGLALVTMATLGAALLLTVARKQMILARAVDDSTRAAAGCGGGATLVDERGFLPDGQRCSPSSVTAYIATRLADVDPSLRAAATLDVYDSAGRTVADSVVGCGSGDTLEITVDYRQPLYVPLLGYVVGDGGSNVLTLESRAEAACHG